MQSLFKIVDVIFKCCFDPWRVATREIGVLEGVCWFEECLHIKDFFFLKSVAFVNTCIQESDFCARDFSSECWGHPISSLVMLHNGNIIRLDISFPHLAQSRSAGSRRICQLLHTKVH